MQILNSVSQYWLKFQKKDSLGSGYDHPIVYSYVNRPRDNLNEGKLQQLAQDRNIQQPVSPTSLFFTALAFTCLPTSLLFFY